MEKQAYLTRKLRPLNVRQRSVSQLLSDMTLTGFQGKSLGQAVEVIKRMIQDPANTIILGCSGSMSTTGQSKLIKWLIDNRYVDVVVSTGANISEDLLEPLGFAYYQGSHVVDDADLLKNQIDRFYDVYADELEYRQLEGFLEQFMEGLDNDRAYSSAEFLNLLGKHQDHKGVDGISASAYRAGVPVFSPALADSGYGVAAYTLHKRTGKHVVLDQFKDLIQLGDIAERSQSTSVIYLGGGVPKDTIQLTTVMKSLAQGGDTSFPHAYAVQITTDSPQWGGLSGCTLEEAISWGKIADAGMHVTCYCDATIALPLICQALSEQLSGPRHGVSFDWLLAPA